MVSDIARVLKRALKRGDREALDNFRAAVVEEAGNPETAVEVLRRMVENDDELRHVILTDLMMRIEEMAEAKQERRPRGKAP
jgi:hypothetical protein